MTREPALLWQHFEKICKIPHSSGNEGGLRAFVRAFAGANGFGYSEDSAGNCAVSVAGRGAGVDGPSVILQAHMDMVCVADEEQAGRAHDFARDPILTREAVWLDNGSPVDVLMATGTTLGADNGIGMAAALAAAIDPSVVDCPPLELLFTVEEETGLIGARKLDRSLLKGDLLMNLDSEALGEICVSCAGGREMVANWRVEREDPASGAMPVRVFLAGLPGGHSGVQIHERRGNAILMLLQEVQAAVEGADIRVAAFSGGSAGNVIPSQAEMVLWVSSTHRDALAAAFMDPAMKARLSAAVSVDGEEGITCGSEPVAPNSAARPILARQTRAILSAIAGLPNGPRVWSDVVPGLVETSNNVAIVEMSEDTVMLDCSTRSSRVGAIEQLQRGMRATLEASGAAVTVADGYPGWPADADNPLLTRAVRVFQAVLGHAPTVSAVHAGLECGVFKGLQPDLRMISFGPTIHGAHTVQERVVVDSIPPFYACLTSLLRDMIAVGG